MKLICKFPEPTYPQNKYLPFAYVNLKLPLALMAVAFDKHQSLIFAEFFTHKIITINKS